MGQGVFEYPTPDGYPDKISSWLGTLLWRWNFAFALAANQAPGANVPFEKLTHASPLPARTGENAAIKLFEHCTGHAPSAEQTTALTEAADGKSNDLEAIRKLLGLVLSSPGFQRY